MYTVLTLGKSVPRISLAKIGLPRWTSFILVSFEVVQRPTFLVEQLVFKVLLEDCIYGALSRRDATKTKP